MNLVPQFIRHSERSEKSLSGAFINDPRLCMDDFGTGMNPII
jgi:hypothetical protein